MKYLKLALLLALLPMAFNVNAQTNPAATVKKDSTLLKMQLKAQPTLSFFKNDFFATAGIKLSPVSVIKVSDPQISPVLKFQSNVNVYQPNSIYPTPLPVTTFQPVMITSPGGTVSSINSQGLIVKKK